MHITADWFPAVALAVLILVTSTVPLPAGSAGAGGMGPVPVVIGTTAIFHVVGYAALTTALVRPLGRASSGLLAAITLAVGVGVGIEVVQSAIPWRTFAVVDVGLNAIGAGAAALVVRLRTRNRSSG